MTKLGFTEKEVGRMTLGKFMRLYQHYKDTFDIELVLKSRGITYSQLQTRSEKAETEEEILYF